MTLKQARKMKTKLIPMTDFVKDILSYVNESQSHERAIQLIEWYSDLISLPLKRDMFEGDNPLFPDFKVVKNMRDLNGYYIDSQVVLPCEHDFTVRLYRRSEHSTAKNGMSFITTFNLKKVEDLCSRGVLFNRSSEYAESELLNLFSVSNSAEYTRGYKDGWRDCCKDVKEFG